MRKFNRQEFIQAGLETQLKRAKIMAKGGVNPDFDTQHASEVREYATNGNFTELTARIKKDHTKRQEAIQRRVEKRKA